MSRAPGARVATAALAALLATGAAAHEAAHPDAPEPPALYDPPAPGTYELPVIREVSEHWLLDAGGQRAPVLGVEAGEVAVVSFVYTRCGDACPLALATLQRLDRALAARPELGARTRLVSVSFDPAHDTPARMAQMRDHLAPRGRWAFLTAPDEAALGPVLGDFDQRVMRLPDPSGSATGAPGDRLRHVLKVYLVDHRGRVRNIYSTGFLEPAVLLADVETVLGEPAGKGASAP